MRSIVPRFDLGTHTSRILPFVVGHVGFQTVAQVCRYQRLQMRHRHMCLVSPCGFLT